MDPSFRQRLTPGTRVSVTQQTAGRNNAWTTTVTGTIVAYEQKQTGSWYAHSRGDKLWLDRLVLKKADGEISTLNLDEYSHIDVLGEGADVGRASRENETNLPV